ncbi:hypothetical protein [Streptomyces niveus]|uniref:hypothetical protein n=1 Tax=Streptomyces niveus TaxID=193462 RepID=UPI003652904C
METEFESRLRKTVEQVQACSSIQTEKYDRGPVAIYMERAEDAFEIMRLVMDAPLSVGLTKNFHRYSNLFFSWRALAPFDKISGEFHIVHLAEAVVRGPQPSAFDPETSEVGKLIEEFRIFETHPVGGTGTYSALRFTHNQDSPEIWYFDIRQGPTRLHISYSDYLDVMLRTRGLYNWQYLFAEPDADNYGMRASLPYLRDGLEFLAREFPDDDLSDLRGRLEARIRVAGEGS